VSFIERFSPYIESLRDPREILYIASQANKIYPPLSSNVVFLDLCSSSCGDQDILLPTVGASAVTLIVLWCLSQHYIILWWKKGQWIALMQGY